MKSPENYTILEKALAVMSALAIGVLATGCNQKAESQPGQPRSISTQTSSSNGGTGNTGISAETYSTPPNIPYNQPSGSNRVVASKKAAALITYEIKHGCDNDAALKAVEAALNQQLTCTSRVFRASDQADQAAITYQNPDFTVSEASVVPGENLFEGNWGDSNVKEVKIDGYKCGIVTPTADHPTSNNFKIIQCSLHNPNALLMAEIGVPATSAGMSDGSLIEYASALLNGIPSELLD